MLKNYIILVFCLVVSQIGMAQTNPSEKPINIVLIETGAQFNTPLFDLKEKFGYFTSANVSCKFKSNKNWTLGLTGTYNFGNQLKSDPVSSLRNSFGLFITESGTVTEVNAFLTSFQGMLKAGWLFTSKKKNPNSGLLAEIGIGLTSYKYRFKVLDGSIPLLDKQNTKGYDQLTIGTTYALNIGYLHLSDNARINYYLGTEFGMILGNGQRTWLYNNNVAGNFKTFDGYLGLKLIWILPLYRRAENDFIFF